MDQRIGARSETRGVVLIASGDESFAEVVGELVSDNGFTAACPSPSEGAWLSLARIQPHVVIGDCDAPRRDLQRLVVETGVRRIPLLLSRSPSTNGCQLVLSVGRRVEWITFPTERDVFRAALDRLLPPIVKSRRITAKVLGVRLDLAVSALTLTPQLASD